MDFATKVPPGPLSSSPGFIITMEDKIIHDKDKVKFPHCLHKMGWIELAGLADGRGRRPRSCPGPQTGG